MIMAMAGKMKKAALGAACLAVAVGVPSSVLAFNLAENQQNSLLRDGISAFTPASADPRIARMVAERRGGDARMMRFTPAANGSVRPNRAVTVAVRIDPQAAKALSARNALESSRDRNSGSGGLRIAPTRYNLGLARGYASFAQAPAPALSSKLSGAEIPDLADFVPSAGAQKQPSRFAARIELEEEYKPAPASESAERLGDQMLDVAGSYRLTRNLDVTAGVRYQQDRDILPLPQMDQQDSQAVYIGTQFRF